MTTPAHPLDNVIWSALASQQRALATGDDLARRFPADTAPFGAMAELSDAAFASMTRITVPDDIVALFTLVKVAPPAQFVVEREAPINLMIGPATRRDIDTTGMITLSADDVPDMMALVDLTQPGPFAAKTYRLGTYLGIRLDGKLIAMAGERLHLDGYTEVSAVCVHPDYRGRGLPAALIGAITNGIVARGETPILHVFESNHAASALYKKLGFTTRVASQLTVLKRV